MLCKDWHGSAEPDLPASRASMLQHRLHPATPALPGFPCQSADEPPLALGQWLESKGLVSWAPRGGLKIGPSGCGAGGMGSSGGRQGRL